jgi:ATP-dependent Clp protease ATP-binding subunit ClpA
MSDTEEFDMKRSVVAVLNAAESEAKRRGHDRVTLAHVAVVLEAMDPDMADRILTDDVDAAVCARLDVLPRTFDHPVPDQDMLAVLRECAGQPEPLESLAYAVRLKMTEPESVKAKMSSGGRASFVLPSGVSDYAMVIDPVSPTVSRDETVRQVLSLLATRQPQAPLVVAPEGVGRTGLARSLAVRLADPEYVGALSGWPLVLTRSEGILTGGRVDALLKVFDACRGKAVVYVDDVEVICALGSTAGLDTTMIVALRSALHDPDIRIVMTIASDFVDRFQAADRELFGELERVDLTVMTGDEVRTIAEASAMELSAHHGVTIAPEIVTAAVGPARQSDTSGHPALAVERLDRAATAATLTEGRVAVIADLGIATDERAFNAFDPDAIIARLKTQVLGQDRAIEDVVNRLAITRDSLDARPERPDGVFLFAGPTGTGKTELSLRLAQDLYGSQDALIRLDMSEYADQWSLSKLIGSGPGYIGSTEPEGWLTTRVRNRPQCVLLLDEIEKAHPQIWNTFLQVFDAGRLTDGQGRVADFHDAIIVLTTNMGSAVFADRNAAGFMPATDTADAEAGQVLAEIKRTMRPELLNRLDATLVFRPLEPDTVRRIATMQLDDAVGRLAARGWDVTYTDAVVDVLAAKGYSREYGARPLLRVLEEELLGRVRRLPLGPVQVDVGEGLLVARSGRGS